MSARIPLSVLLLTPNLEIGGAQENLRTMARHLPAAGCSTVVGTFDDGPLRGEIEAIGVPVDVLTARRYSVVALPRFALEMLRTRRQLVDLVDRRRIDVVQTRGLGTLDFLVATLPLTRRAQVWWTIENVRFIVRREHLTRWAWLLRPKRAMHRRLYRIGARMVNGIIAVSDDTARSFREVTHYHGNKLHVVLNAVDDQRFARADGRDAVRARLGFSADDHVMTMVGTFKRQKGHEILITALASVSVRAPRLHLVCIGEGELQEAVCAQVEAAGLTPRVHFLGNRRDVPELLGASDSFVLPSLWEGLPVALIEAMAAGLPVIATAVSGTRQALSDGVTGWLVPPGDAPALSRAMLDLVHNPARAAEMGRAARERIISGFGASRQAEQLAELFRAAARRSSGAARRRLQLRIAAR